MFNQNEFFSARVSINKFKWIKRGLLKTSSLFVFNLLKFFKVVWDSSFVLNLLKLFKSKNILFQFWNRLNLKY